MGVSFNFLDNFFSPLYVRVGGFVREKRLFFFLVSEGLAWWAAGMRVLSIADLGVYGFTRARADVAEKFGRRVRTGDPEMTNFGRKMPSQSKR